MLSIFWILFAYVFNQGELFRISMDTRISTKMEDWGGFATCVTAIFALISIYLAFKALRSQTIAARRASFDATFTQIYAQHNILHQKVTRHDILYLKIKRPKEISICRRTPVNLFTLCREVFYHVHIKSGETTSNQDSKGKETTSNQNFWKNYNSVIGLHVSADFKNYFKYIHREVSYIMDNSKDILSPGDQKKYVKLIEGRMNNDELFCYFINQLDYWLSHNNENKEINDYADYLRKNDFFKEICMTEEYRELIKKALEISGSKIEISGSKIEIPLIDYEWLKGKVY